MLTSLDLSHEQWTSSTILEVKADFRKTTLVAFWKMDLEESRSLKDQ